MRISIMGSHSTGKTTLAKKLCKKFNFNFIPDTAAMAFKKEFVINENTPPETQFWILSKQLELERNTPESWVEEKSLYDNLIYAQFANHPSHTIDTIRDIIERNARYDLIFYLPIEFEIEDDGIRSLDKDFQKAIDRNLQEYLQINNFNYHILRGSVSERLQQSLKLIKNQKQ